MSLLRSNTPGNGLSQLKRHGRRDDLQKQAGSKQKNGKPIMTWFRLELQPWDDQLLPTHAREGEQRGINKHPSLSLLPSQDCGQWHPLAGSNQRPEGQEAPVREPLEVSLLGTEPGRERQMSHVHVRGCSG